MYRTEEQALCLELKGPKILTSVLSMASCVQLGNMQISLNLCIFINSPENEDSTTNSFDVCFQQENGKPGTPNILHISWITFDVRV